MVIDLIVRGNVMDSYFSHNVIVPTSLVERYSSVRGFYEYVIDLLLPGAGGAIFTKHPGNEITVVSTRNSIPDGLDGDWLRLNPNTAETFTVSKDGIRSRIHDDSQLTISSLVGVYMSWDEILMFSDSQNIDLNVALDWRVPNDKFTISDTVNYLRGKK